MADRGLLKLVALDADDLAIISACLQDAIMRVEDVHWMKRQGKLALIANRFDHASTSHGKGERRHCGLQISRVQRVTSQNIAMNDKSALLSLLTITYTPGNSPPEGIVELIFSGGGTLRLDVECVEAAMADLSTPWPAKARPDHEGDGDQSRNKDASA